MTTMSLHAISSPMTLKNVEHSGVTRKPAISTSTTSAVKAPDRVNSCRSQSPKSPVGSIGSAFDKRQLRKLLLEQRPERIAPVLEVPGFELGKRVCNGRRLGVLRWGDVVEDG